MCRQTKSWALATWLLSLTASLLCLSRSSSIHRLGAVPNSKVKELLVLTSPLSRVILGPFDILVDIGVPAEKEVIQ
jgi:hypothetical protein